MYWTLRWRHNERDGVSNNHIYLAKSQSRGIVYWTLRWRHNDRDGVSNDHIYLVNLEAAGLCIEYYGDVIMTAMASQITSVSIVSSAVCPGVNQRKHQSSASVAFVRGIHRWPVNSPHKGPVKRKIFPFDDVIMKWLYLKEIRRHCCQDAAHTVISLRLNTIDTSFGALGLYEMVP